MNQAVSADKQAALLDSQRRVLERLASGAPLEDVLLTLVRLIEEQADGMQCTVLLADPDRQRLRFGAAPRLPRDVRARFEALLRIAPGICACSEAAYRMKPVYTADIATDPLWTPCRDLALGAGLRASWSTPILADDNRVLGTFGMNYGEPRLPDEQQIKLIDMAVQMARVAIEAKEGEDLLHFSFDLSPRALLITDMDGRIARANEAFARLLGYEPADLRGKPMAEILDAGEAGVARSGLASMEAAVDRRYRSRSGKVLFARERSSLQRDPAGAARYRLTVIEKMAAQDPVASLSPRERQVLDLVVAGESSKTIAARLRLSPGSIDTYRSRIMLKLGTHNLPELVRFAIRCGVASA